MTYDYISHARNAEELRAEVLGDLRRRIASLDMQHNAVRFSQAEKARIARAIGELQSMLDFWSELKILGKERKTKP